MKLMIVIVIPCFVIMRSCVNQDAGSIAAMQKKETVATDRKIEFDKEVLPVLKNNCSPCHFPDGKMYDKLPFDKAATLIDNGDKILKRVEKDEKKKIVKEFILRNKK